MGNFIIRDRSEDESIDKLKAIRSKVESLTPEEYQMFKELISEDGIDPEKLRLMQSILYLSLIHI